MAPMKDNGSDPRLRLKVTPPRWPKRLFLREPLGLSRPELHDKPVLIVNAPAGFGKTSLLTQWRREWLSRGAIVAWLTLDDDDDPVRFSEALAVAMDLASGRRAFSRIGLRTALADGEIDRLTEWLSEVADLGVESALILDEADHLPVQTAQQSLMYILSNLPPNLHIALASRARLDLPLADLVARGLLTRVTVDSLRFSLAETIAILQARFGTRLDPDACARLHDLSEGWPLGLQLAISTLETGPDPRELLARVSARTGDIRRYFVESLMAQLPAPLADFLVRIAIVDRVHPSLCAALTGREDAAALLAELRAVTPIFVEGVDSDWAAIHPLAHEFLLDRCEQLPAAERQAMHAAAAAWFSGHQMCEQAARHALRAGDPDAAWSLAERSLFDTFASGRPSGVIEWIDRMPRTELDKRPRLLLAAGWARAMSARHAEALPFARRVLDSPRVDQEDRYLALLMVGAAAFYADALDEAAAIVDQWYGIRPTHDTRLLQFGVNQLAMLTLYRGNPAEARLQLQQAWAPLSDGDISYAAGIRVFIEGLSFIWEGQIVRAVETLREGLTRAESATGRRGAVASTLAGPIAIALWEQDKLDEAANVLANRLDVIEYLATPDALISSYVVAARIAAASGEERRAYSLLEALCVLGETRVIPRVCVAALAEMIRMHALKNRAETCTTLLSRLDAVFVAFPQAVSGLLGDLLQLHREIAAAHTAGARRDWQRMQDVLATAGPLADRLRRARESIEIKLLRGVAMRASGGDAVSLLGEAVSLAETYGFVRMLRDTHCELQDPSAQSLSPGYLQRRAPPARSGQASALTASPGPAAGGPATARVSPSALLTPKEREVLQLLSRRLSNKQIAAALDLGDATVKWHLKNLFAKLNAGSREHALQRSRMLGILEGN